MDDVLGWLLEGDPAIAWQAQRDLTGGDWESTRATVAHTGWGAQLLDSRSADGTWPIGWYSPKWTSTFYSLQLLQQLGVRAPESAAALLREGLKADGTFALWSSGRDDVCVTAMMLTMATEAGLPMPGTEAHLIAQQMPDGGWNCRRNASHSSFHTTLSVLEALRPFESSATATQSGREFLLEHRLFRSHRTGNVARGTFTRFSFPCYWYYDALRALDYWRGFGWDERLADGLDLLLKRRRNGTWRLQNKHAGQT